VAQVSWPQSLGIYGKNWTTSNEQPASRIQNTATSNENPNTFWALKDISFEKEFKKSPFHWGEKIFNYLPALQILGFSWSEDRAIVSKT